MSISKSRVHRSKPSLGNDTLIGVACNDHLRGGDGNDVVIGRSVSDKLSDELGHLDGGAGNDRLDNGDGDDQLSLISAMTSSWRCPSGASSRQWS